MIGRLLGKPAEVERHVREYYATRPTLEDITPKQPSAAGAAGDYETANVAGYDADNGSLGVEARDTP